MAIEQVTEQGIPIPQPVHLGGVDMENLRQQIEWDYSEDRRWGNISAGMWPVLNRLVLPLYAHELKFPNQSGYVQYAKALVEHVTMGPSVSLAAVHGSGKDCEVLAAELLRCKPTLRLGAVICPDWGWHDEDGTVVYDMDTLNGGLSKTAERVIEYLATLSAKSQALQRSVSFTGFYPAWELTRADFMSGINGGITSAEALSLLNHTVGVTKEHLQRLEGDHFSTDVQVVEPDRFHLRARQEAERLLVAERKRIQSVLSARRCFHKGEFNMNEAALELAEHRLGFEEITRVSDVLIVPTSPTIARACLSGGDAAWIQLNHGYKG